MVELKSEKLAESYLNFIAIRNSVVYVQTQTYSRSNDEFLRAIGFPYIGEIAKDRKAFIGQKMDKMVRSIEELIVLGLVADFEKMVFDNVENASGAISKIVKEKYINGAFKDCSTGFVKTIRDIDKLSIIKEILSPKLPKELSDQFKEIVEFRNRLAHGKRFGKDSLLSFDDIALILDDVLNYI